MHHQAGLAPHSRIGTHNEAEPRGRIAGANLLGVHVTALAMIHAREHERRQLTKIAAVTDPELLGRLLELPAAVPISDPVAWAETADQPAGIVGRASDGITVIRHLVPPLSIEDVIISASPGQELLAVQEASLFAGFTRRWVEIAGNQPPEPTLLEAKLCGVGIIDPAGRTILGSSDPLPRMDGWVWMLQEKAYQWWLSQQSRAHAKESQSAATGATSEQRAG